MITMETVAASAAAVPPTESATSVQESPTHLDVATCRPEVDPHNVALLPVVEEATLVTATHPHRCNATPSTIVNHTVATTAIETD